MQRTLLNALILIIVLMASGCASTGSQKEQTALWWPAPPEEPRFAYVKFAQGEADFAQRGFWDSIFGAPPISRLRKPAGLYAYGGKVYVACTDAGSVAVIDDKARKVTYIGDSGTGKLSNPIGRAGTSDGSRIFVADAKLGKVYGYDTATGELKLAIGKSNELKNPVGVALNEGLKRIYVLDSHEAEAVHVYSLTGEPLFRFGKRGLEADGMLYYPYGIAIDKRNGNVYIVDTQNFRVQVFDKDGVYVRKFGAMGDLPGTFSRPKGIGVDSEGHVYVVDTAFNNFQIFDEKGGLLMFIGAPGYDRGNFTGPSGLYVDENDRIYVADSLNGRVQIFQYLSEKWKKENPEEYKKYLLN